MTIKPLLYSKDTIEQLPWADTIHSAPERQILTAFITSGPERYIKNAHTQTKALLIGNLVLPITICESPNHSAYVCSPFTHYVTYGREEINSLKNPILRKMLISFLEIFGKVLKSCLIDKNVFVNNWLFPTNLHANLSVKEINAITQTLVSHFPDHAILFRSVSSNHPSHFFNNLKNSGYSLVMSREVYFTDPTNEAAFKSRMFKSDQKLLNNSPYKVISDIKTLRESAPRIKELYEMLNIQKYSKCNPQYSEEFIKLALDTGWMTFKGFEKEGKIDGVFGYFSKDQIMTSPFFGYDTSLPSEIGLYRQIATQLLLDAKEKNMLLHQSAGAGHYKKLRRAKDFPEYTAVYYRHLNFKRKACWLALKKLMDTFGKQFMKNE